MVKHQKVCKYYEHDCGFPIGDKQQFLTIYGDHFSTIFGGNLKSFIKAIILGISVRLTLKELRCDFSSFFYIISDSEEGGILFLQIAVMFEMKKKNESKRKHRIPEFFHKQEKKDHSAMSQ